MEEDYVFAYRIDGKIIREDFLDKVEKSLLMNGLNYARERDSIDERRKRYLALMRKLNKVINGEKRVKRKL